MFQLTEEEVQDLILHSARASWGGAAAVAVYLYGTWSCDAFGGAPKPARGRNEHSGGAGVCEIARDGRFESGPGGEDEKLEDSQREHASVINILAEEIDMLKTLPATPSKRIGFQAG